MIWYSNMRGVRSWARTMSSAATIACSSTRSWKSRSPSEYLRGELNMVAFRSCSLDAVTNVPVPTVPIGTSISKPSSSLPIDAGIS